MDSAEASAVAMSPVGHAECQTGNGGAENEALAFKAHLQEAETFAHILSSLLGYGLPRNAALTAHPASLTPNPILFCFSTWSNINIFVKLVCLLFFSHLLNILQLPYFLLPQGHSPNTIILVSAL